MDNYLDFMRHFPWLGIVVVGAIAGAFWFVAMNFGGKGSTRWQAFIIALVLFAFMCSGIYANITG